MRNTPEPLISRTDESWKVPLDILNIIELGREGISHINNDDLPVGLALVKKCHYAENLDLLDLPNESNLLSDLANVERVIVTPCLRFRVHLIRVFPCLPQT